MPQAVVAETFGAIVETKCFFGDAKINTVEVSNFLGQAKKVITHFPPIVAVINLTLLAKIYEHAVFICVL